jgi:hypothetical protein
VKSRPLATVLPPTAGPLQRQAAAGKVGELIDVLRAQSGTATSALIEECEALARAIAAFHMEGIRFRIYNVDDGTGQVAVISRTGSVPPAGARVQVKGRVGQLAAVGGRSIGLHVQEEQRRFRPTR